MGNIVVVVVFDVVLVNLDLYAQGALLNKIGIVDAKQLAAICKNSFIVLLHTFCLLKKVSKFCLKLNSWSSTLININSDLLSLLFLLRPFLAQDFSRNLQVNIFFNIFCSLFHHVAGLSFVIGNILLTVISLNCAVFKNTKLLNLIKILKHICVLDKSAFVTVELKCTFKNDIMLFMLGPDPSLIMIPECSGFFCSPGFNFDCKFVLIFNVNVNKLYYYT